MNYLRVFSIFVLLSGTAVFATAVPKVSTELDNNPAHPSGSNIPHSANPAPQKWIEPSGPAASQLPAVPKASPAATDKVTVKASPIPVPESPSASPSDAAPAPAVGTDTAPVGQEEAEVPTEAPQTTTRAVCFPADATVVLESGEVLEMENLEVGHRVQVAENQFSTVVMFTHALRGVKHSFVQLTTASGKTIRATEGHYIYADGKLTRMGDVIVGNVLETSSRNNEQVVSITRGTGRGLYNPQTAHGDIIVAGIRASTYTETIPNKAAHAMLAPVRAVFAWTGLQINALEKIVW